jgi:hypothetical protein
MGGSAIVIATFCQTNMIRPDARTSLAHSLSRLGQPEEHEEKVGQRLIQIISLAKKAAYTYNG